MVKVCSWMCMFVCVQFRHLPSTHNTFTLFTMAMKQQSLWTHLTRILRRRSKNNTLLWISPSALQSIWKRQPSEQHCTYLVNRPFGAVWPMPLQCHQLEFFDYPVSAFLGCGSYPRSWSGKFFLFSVLSPSQSYITRLDCAVLEMSFQLNEILCMRVCVLNFKRLLWA